MKAEADVQAGICGHHTKVRAETNDGRQVTFTIETSCDNIERFKVRLAEGGPLDAYEEINPKAYEPGARPWPRGAHLHRLHRARFGFEGVTSGDGAGAAGRRRHRDSRGLTSAATAALVNLPPLSSCAPSLVRERRPRSFGGGKTKPPLPSTRSAVCHARPAAVLWAYAKNSPRLPCLVHRLNARWGASPASLSSSRQACRRGSSSSLRLPSTSSRPSVWSTSRASVTSKPLRRWVFRAKRSAASSNMAGRSWPTLWSPARRSSSAAASTGSSRGSGAASHARSAGSGKTKRSSPRSVPGAGPLT